MDRRHILAGGAMMATLAVVSCSSEPSGSGDAEELGSADIDDAIRVTSPEFGEGEPIPVMFTCDGEDVSPTLAWEGVPADAA